RRRRGPGAGGGGRAGCSRRGRCPRLHQAWQRHHVRQRLRPILERRPARFIPLRRAGDEATFLAHPCDRARARDRARRRDSQDDLKEERNPMPPAALKLAIVLTTPALSIGPPAPAPAAATKMKSVDGKSRSIADVTGKNGTLVIFTCNHCPFARA